MAMTNPTSRRGEESNLSGGRSATWHTRCACQSAAVASQPWEDAFFRLILQLTALTSSLHVYQSSQMFWQAYNTSSTGALHGAFGASYNAWCRCQATFVDSRFETNECAQYV